MQLSSPRMGGWEVMASLPLLFATHQPNQPQYLLADIADGLLETEHHIANPSQSKKFQSLQPDEESHHSVV